MTTQTQTKHTLAESFKIREKLYKNYCMVYRDDASTMEMRDKARDLWLDSFHFHSAMESGYTQMVNWEGNPFQIVLKNNKVKTQYIKL